MGSALIVGGDSLIGSVLGEQCRAAGLATEVTSRRSGAALLFDLGNPDFSRLAGRSYDVAFLCAAVTDMRTCQNEPLATRHINVDNTIELMRRLADKGTHLVFFSTSQVFDGTAQAPAEDAVANPRNQYGAQKRAVERAIARYDFPAAILRITKVLGDRPTGIFEAWRRALAGDGSIQAATNLALSPVAAGDAGSLARQLAAGRHRGIWHLGAADSLTYVEAARLLVESAGQPSSRVVGETLMEAQVPSIFRLGNARLACAKITRTFGIVPKPARDILGKHFAAAAACV
ncbi:MAG: sugar nucleotide-binding protein [Reyranellaceae bacterium]